MSRYERNSSSSSSRRGGGGGPTPQDDAISRRGMHNRPWMAAGDDDNDNNNNNNSSNDRERTGATTAPSGSFRAARPDPSRAANHSATIANNNSNSSVSESRQADQLVQAYLQRRSRDEDDDDSVPASTVPQSQQQQSQQQQSQSSSYARYLQQKQDSGSSVASDHRRHATTTGTTGTAATSSSSSGRNRRPPRGVTGSDSVSSVRAESVAVAGKSSWRKTRQATDYDATYSSALATGSSSSGGGDAAGAGVAETSRELRARRLREKSRLDTKSRAERHAEGNTNTAAAATATATHYQAHSPLVEKYLTRSKLIEGVQPTQSVPVDAVGSPPPSASVPTLSVPTASVPSASVPTASVPTASASAPTDPRDETKHTLNSSVRGWSTRGSRASAASASSAGGRAETAPPDATTATASVFNSSNNNNNSNNNVDDYLAQRNAQKRSTLVEPGIPTRSTPALELNTSTSLQSNGFTTDESESQDDSECDSDSGDSETQDDAPEWSLRATVVSAVDFPTNVVPNLPFSPVLKVALVQLPSQGENPQGVEAPTKAAAEETRRRELAASIESKGIASIPRARIRSTSSKILSKRDNGSVEFHEEMRWDRLQSPSEWVLVIELSARAVMSPPNARESPPAQKEGANSRRAPGSPGKSPNRRAGSGNGSDSGFGALWRKGTQPLRPSGSTEMQTANAAAAVAKLLVGNEDVKGDQQGTEEGGGPLFDSKTANLKSLAGNQSEMDVKLRPRKSGKRRKMTDDIRLGSQIVTLSKLPLAKAMSGKYSARIEQWVELDTLQDVFPPSNSGRSPSKTTRRSPSILMEICLSTPERMDDSEDDMDEDGDTGPRDEINASFSKRASMKIRSQLKDEKPQAEVKEEEPVLQPGFIDFIAVVGARDIGSQTGDDGAKGWVNSTPECCLLEQFPPSDDVHLRNGRKTVLPNKVEWFCFPEGVKLWRGKRPPTHEDLNLTRFSAASPPNVASSIAAFDACLGCTTTFTWFVIASNSDEYGSDSVKTYGAVIRFYVPAPAGIDPTQDDFAQTMLDPNGVGAINGVQRRRLWVPIGICITSSLPIVGAMETMLLRLCKELGPTQGVSSANSAVASTKKLVYEELKHAIFNYQKPIRGVVQCSVPFLSGERMHISLPPRTGLPTLPHGNSVVSVCRLVGADGLNFLLAAFLTECKIVIHSNDVANLCLVAEVMTALLYPFSWSLPYIPVLPAEMMEFIEAPLSYLLGVPSCNVKLVDPSVFEDVVVIDLDRDFSSSGYYEGRRVESSRAKAPTPLPATTASNISKAVYRLLRAEEEVEEAIGNSRFFPRMEPESLAEREFRLSVALEVSGLIKGYEDNLVFASSSQPVFNVDKFLQTAPALFEQQRGATTAAQPSGGQSNRVLSPRSKRFLSQLVNCQHFHQLLETLHSEQAVLFHEMMGVLKADGGKRGKSKLGDHFTGGDSNTTIEQLIKYTQKREDKIPTYRVKRNASEHKDETVDSGDMLLLQGVLQPIVIADQSSESSAGGQDQGKGTVKSLSLEYLVELEKNPWRYSKLFNISLNESDSTSVELVKLKDAIGERRYRAWKAARDRKRFDPDDVSVVSDDSDSKGSASATALDLKGLMLDTDDGPIPSSDSIQQRIVDAKDRDALRRCLEKAWAGGDSNPEMYFDKGRNLITEAEAALRNRSAQHFLLTVLKKRLRVESQGSHDQEESRASRRNSQTASKLEPAAFEVLVRLGCAMLDACMEDKNYDTAYSFLKHTAGLYTNAPDSSDEALLYMTGRIGHHPIFADLGVWEKVKDLHLVAHQDDKEGDKAVDKDDAEYEAAKATLYEMLGYGIPAEELARFVSRVSETHGWFQSERGKTLLLLARRLSVRREQGADSTNPATTSDIEMMSPKSLAKPMAQIDPHGAPEPPLSSTNLFARCEDDDGEQEWTEIGWCHPAAKSSRRLFDKSKRSGAQSTPEDVNFVPPGKSSSSMKRSAVTSLAYLGSSVVVTGGLDGGVFMTRKVNLESDTPTSDTTSEQERYGVCGVHLDWGSSGSRYAVGTSSTSLDGEYGVGSVACLAATRGAEHHYSDPAGKPSTKDVSGPLDDEDLLSAMEGNRVVAGTTCGDLRVWSVKDVFAAVFYTSGGGDVVNQHEGRLFRGDGASSGFISGRRKATTDFAAGSSLTRLKFSLRGRALSGHRGGVSCIDVPSNVYRPDSIVSGGADGLIKLWSLRAPGASVGRRNEMDKGTTQLLSPAGGDTLSPRAKAARNGDALSILSGHGGRVLTVKTAWHGDRLLSGGADRTVRIWDLAGSGGKCLHTLSGHFGWVTSVHYWGPNTIISASTDRSIALWDARVRSSPLFTLRHHHAPVSDLLVGSRTDPVMVSAASDGSIAAWDFRHLSDAQQVPINYATAAEAIATPKKKQRQLTVVRHPAAKLYMHDFCRRQHVFGPVSLARGSSNTANNSSSSAGGSGKTVFVLGGDAVQREWDYQSGTVVSEHVTGHCDTVSGFKAIQDNTFLDTQLESSGLSGKSTVSGTISTSWDGTVRMRTLRKK